MIKITNTQESFNLKETYKFNKEAHEALFNKIKTTLNDVLKPDLFKVENKNNQQIPQSILGANNVIPNNQTSDPCHVTIDFDRISKLQPPPL